MLYFASFVFSESYDENLTEGIQIVLTELWELAKQRDKAKLIVASLTFASYQTIDPAKLKTYYLHMQRKFAKNEG